MAQTALDAQIQKLESDNAALKTENDTLTAENAVLTAKLSATTPGTTPATAPVTKWWRPATTALGADASNIGVDQATLFKFTGMQKVKGKSVLAPFKAGQPASVTVPDNVLMVYASCGFKPDGSRAFGSEADFQKALTDCDNIKLASTPEQADAVIKNAGTMPTDVAIAARLFNVTALEGSGLAGTPYLTVAGAQSFADLIAEMYKAGEPSGERE
jgi:hypothetical protein